MWHGFAIGAVIGGGAGDDPPAPSTPTHAEDNELGGSKNWNSDEDSDNGGQGLFSLWGKQVWLYLGYIGGWGDKAGLYVTTGPMIGANPDWAVGGGVHIAKAFGVGMVIPLRQALTSANKHQDKLGYILDTSQQYLASAQQYLTEAVVRGPEMASSLEQVVRQLC